MKIDIVRAWKDAISHQSLRTQEPTLLSEKLIDTRELTDTDLQGVHGGLDIGVGIDIDIHSESHHHHHHDSGNDCGCDD